MNEGKSETPREHRDEDRPSNRRRKLYFSAPVLYERRKPTLKIVGKESITDCQAARYWG
jgi:hypothetical protein